MLTHQYDRVQVVHAVRAGVWKLGEGVRQHVHVAIRRDEEPESGGSKQRLDELARPPRAQWRFQETRVGARAQELVADTPGEVGR